ncbi:MAG: alginate lyase family protein [bacterium]|nr:alginate lyase family protein [bacterium]
MAPKISRSRMLFISNKSLFEALNLEGSDLAPVREAAHAGRWKEAYSAWGVYFANRLKPMNMVSPTGTRSEPQVIHEAERVVAHEIQGWHTLTYKFGKKVDFNADWGRSGIYGTHYWGWSESLRTAFGQTGDLRYPACFDDLFNQWYEQRDKIDNPIPNLDVIFYELGVGGRTPRFIDHYFAYRQTGVLSWRTHERMLKTILGGCRWLHLLERDSGYRDGNWQMCGSWALVYAGGVFPEFQEAKDWVDVGVDRLVAHVDKDFYADGCHYERASGYGSWCTRMSEDLLTFSEQNDHVKAPENLRANIERMYDWFLATTTPLGESQGFNDGGFGRQDSVLSQGAAFTGDGRFLWPVRDRVKSVNGIRPKQPGFTSIDKRPSGFAVMRSGWQPRDLYLIVNYGPWGGGHAHNDLLDFGMYAFGEPLAIESNRWGPYDNPLDPYFRSPQAHNQLVVNDTPLDRVHHRGEDVVWATGDRIDFFSARHRGYEKSHGCVIERRITFVKPDYFLVSDTVFEGPQHQSYTWYLHSPFKWKTGKTRSITSGSPGLQVVPASPKEIRYVRQGTSYEKKDGAPGAYPNRYWMGLQKWVQGEGVRAVVYDVAMVPFKTSPGPVTVTRLPARVDGKEMAPEHARGVRIVRGNRTDLIVYGTGEEMVTCEGLQFKGKVCVLSLRRDKPESLAVVDGGEVVHQDRELMGTGKMGLTEMTFQGKGK